MIEIIEVVHEAETVGDELAYQKLLVSRLEKVLDFYASAWQPQFAFLTGEIIGYEPNDALLDDVGMKAKAILGRA